MPNNYKDIRIDFNRPYIAHNQYAYIRQSIESGHISGDGPFSKKCHAFFEQTMGVKKALLTTNCTHALDMTALLLNLKEGDEVIVPSFTFVSTVNAFVLRGARPVFADIREDTLNIDERAIEGLITEKTRAIYIVHYAGVACDMDIIMQIAEKYHLPVVEDNAHGLFGKYKGQLRIFNRALTFNEVAQLYQARQYSTTMIIPGPYLITNVVSGVEYTVTAFMDLDGNGRLDDGEPRGSYVLNPVLVTNNVTGVDIHLSVPGEGWTMRATHALAEYDSPGSSTVVCEVFYPTNQTLLGLGWTVGLPEGWELLSAAGDGQPTVNTANKEILFSGPKLTNNPIRFTYDVDIPRGEIGPKAITGTVDYFLSGIATWEVRMAEPNPLVVNPAIPYHSSDFREPRWVIDLQEVNRTLSYWRSGGYGVRPGTVDGYAPNETSRDGRRHKADYQEPYWQLDGEEALRIIGYWMAGGYHPDPAGVDGYAPGSSTNGAMGIMDISDISVMSVMPETYVPGRQVTLRGTLNYSSDIVALLWKPLLPAGWTIVSVSANGGTPEVVNNEILFTSKLPPSPLEIVYVCNVPDGTAGDALVQTDVQIMRHGTANPQSLLGMMSPNLLQLDSDGDGLPDWVETGTGVYRSPTDTGTCPFTWDSDGDGVSDGDEVRAGTNPNLRDDVFRILSLAPKTGDFIMSVGQPYEVRWSSVAGKTYSVFRTTNLIEGFTVLRSNVLATPPINTFIDTLPPDPKASYTIGVE